MAAPMIYVSHDSALYFWRTNPSWYVLDGLNQNIRALRKCPTTAQQLRELDLFEAEVGPNPIHVLVPPGAPRHGSPSYGAPRLKFHLQKAKLPPHALCPLHGGIHVVSPEVCLVQMCATRPFIEALQIGMEFCGTYALRPYSIEDDGRRDYTLVNAEKFKRHVNSWKGLHGLVQARKVATFLQNGAASPMETVLYLLLCLPQMYGGYNLPRPELNADVPLTPAGQEVMRQENVRPDLLWRDAHIAVEYDGEYHNDPIQARRDELRRSLLESMGYTVFVFKKQHVYNPIVFNSMVEALAKRLRKRIRPLTTKQAFARDDLRAQLLVKGAAQEEIALEE